MKMRTKAISIIRSSSSSPKTIPIILIPHSPSPKLTTSAHRAPRAVPNLVISQPVPDFMSSCIPSRMQPEVPTEPPREPDTPVQPPTYEPGQTPPGVEPPKGPPEITPTTDPPPGVDPTPEMPTPPVPSPPNPEMPGEPGNPDIPVPVPVPVPPGIDPPMGPPEIVPPSPPEIVPPLIF